MDFEFTKMLPENYTAEIGIISGADSLAFDRSVYLVVKNKRVTVSIFELRYEYSCSSFKEAQIIDNILAAGHEEHFYLYNLDSNQTYYKLDVNGYFGNLYFYDNLFFVTDAWGMHCIEKEGKVIWHNASIAVDGVIINNFEAGKI